MEQAREPAKTLRGMELEDSSIAKAVGVTEEVLLEWFAEETVCSR